MTKAKTIDNFAGTVSVGDGTTGEIRTYYSLSRVIGNSIAAAALGALIGVAGSHIVSQGDKPDFVKSVDLGLVSGNSIIIFYKSGKAEIYSPAPVTGALLKFTPNPGQQKTIDEATRELRHYQQRLK